MELPIYVVDAFSRGPFTGNPAGVVPLGGALPDDLMLKIAAEMKHAETAFFFPEGDGYRLRWFTPELEVDLCGHATVAATWVLFHQALQSPGVPIKFHTKSGALSAELVADEVRLNFPALPTTPCDERNNAQSVLGQTVVGTHYSRFDLLVELENEQAVRNTDPDFARLSQHPWRGVIITARSQNAKYDFVSRFFAPNMGVPEDPATGSAHCSLAPFWAQRLGKLRMWGRQVSKRGGEVGVELENDRVILSGRAHLILKGTLSI